MLSYSWPAFLMIILENNFCLEICLEILSSVELNKVLFA